MPKRRCIFTAKLQKDFPFIHSKSGGGKSDVICVKCSTSFSVAHSGKGDILQHISTDKHKLQDRNLASSSTLNKFFSPKTFGSNEKKLAATEGLFAYHIIRHNQSFRSADCMSKIVKKVFEPKYSSGRTKTEAIIKKVFLPMVLEKLDQDVNPVKFITVLSDASNHKDMKIFPLLIRFFLPKFGIQTKILDINCEPGETSDIISNYIITTLKNNNLDGKLVALSADNTNCNFGGAARKGENNVFYKLQEAIKRPLVGVGCPAHILNNCIQSAADKLPVDVEAIIVKIYGYFYIHTVRVEALKEFCSFVDIEYKKVLGYSKTRWLSLMPAVDRVLKLFPALKSYFLSQDNCPKILTKFFQHHLSEVWLHFIHAEATSFHSTILKIEGDNISFIEVLNILKQFENIIVQKKENTFVPLTALRLLRSLEDDGMSCIAAFEEQVRQFYDKCLAYLKKWINPQNKFDYIDWILLQKVPEWSQIQNSLEKIMENQLPNLQINDTELFDEFTNIKAYVSAEKLSIWNTEKVSSDNRWVEIIDHFEKNSISFKNILPFVEYCMCLPGTNASIERVFSRINNYWTTDKTQLDITTLKAAIMVSYNYNMDCLNFYDSIKDNDTVLKQIHNSAKYI